MNWKEYSKNNPLYGAFSIRAESNRYFFCTRLDLNFLFNGKPCARLSGKLHGTSLCHFPDSGHSFYLFYSKMTNCHEFRHAVLIFLSICRTGVRSNEVIRLSIHSIAQLLIVTKKKVKPKKVKPGHLPRIYGILIANFLNVTIFC